MEIANNVCEAVGNTPMVYLNKVTAGCKAKVAVKLEYLNPACSIKDRVAVSMINAAEKEGKIKPRISTIIEPTSGNTGIGLAMVCACKGYNLILTMPETMSIERRSVIMAYGASVVLTEAAKGMEGSVDMANELAAKIPNSFIPLQFENYANSKVHYETTGPEIWKQSMGKVDIAVFSVGTGGTLTGAGKFLKEKNSKIEIYAIEPKESQALVGGPIGSHKIQGIGANFIPKILDTGIYKDVLHVPSDDALKMSRRLAREEGILCGISSGANVCAAIELAKKSENSGKLIVTVLPSFGERYLSSVLYSEIKDEAQELSAEPIDDALIRIKNHSTK
uniref:Cysteine synthase n=1 Tax=Syphacia muris TaxID=451379 RepID=A0A0N5AIP0_9BILA